MKFEKSLFQVGAHVRLSELGKSRMMRGTDRRGRVVGLGRTETVVRVQFENLHNPVSLHQSYLERDKRAEIEARLSTLSSEPEAH